MFVLTACLRGDSFLPVCNTGFLGKQDVGGGLARLTKETPGSGHAWPEKLQLISGYFQKRMVVSPWRCSANFWRQTPCNKHRLKPTEVEWRARRKERGWDSPAPPVKAFPPRSPRLLSFSCFENLDTLQKEIQWLTIWLLWSSNVSNKTHVSRVISASQHRQAGGALGERGCSIVQGCSKLGDPNKSITSWHGGWKACEQHLLGEDKFRICEVQRVVFRWFEPCTMHYV